MTAVHQNPYIGPRTFRREEGHLFFGREREARDLLSLVASERLVLFYAQSGAGKSSLINTRLVPDLEMKEYEVLPVGRVGGDSPAGQEVDNIFVHNLIRSWVQQEMDPVALARLSLSSFLAKLNRNEQGYFYDDSPIPELPEDEEFIASRRALIIDQFEELFSTHPEAWEKREDFFVQLAKAMQDDPYLWVVLVMREDYIATLDPYAHLLPGGLRVRYYMQRLGREAALRAVKKPVETLRPFAKGVAEKLVDDLCSIKVLRLDGSLDTQPGQYVEPVQLQVVCHNLWENLSPDGTQITEKDLEDVGDVNQSLGNYYAGRVKAVAEARNIKERKIREWVADKLISPGGIRNMVLQEPGQKTAGLEHDVIQALHDLVRAEQRGGATFYELTHDRLVEPIIENNKKWEEEHYSPLQRQAALWNDQGRNDSWLLSGQALEDVEQWAREHPDELTEHEKEFLKACRAKQVEEQRLAREQSARRQRFVLAVVTTALVISLFLTVFAWNARNEATAAQQIASTNEAEAIQGRNAAATAQADASREATLARAGRLAAQSQVVLEDDPRLSLLLSIESLNLALQEEQTYFPVAETVLRRAIEAVGNGFALTGHDSPVRVIAFSPDGKWLASGSEDNTIRLWGAKNDDPSSNTRIFNGHTSTITALAFSPKEDLLVSGSSDSSLRLWDLGTDNSTNAGYVLSYEAGQIHTLVFSPDGDWLAVGSPDPTVRLWNVGKRNPEPTPLNGHESAITDLAFSPDGRLLATGSEDSTVRLWNMSDLSAEPIVLTGHSGSVHSLSFSPEGRWLATGADDSSVRLWDMKAEDRDSSPVTLDATGPIRALVFSPDGKQLAASSGDLTVRLWDMNTDDPNSNVIVLSGPTSWTNALAFSPDGRWLASGSDDYIVGLWDLSSSAESPAFSSLGTHSGSVFAVTFNDDGSLLASAAYDSTPRLWDISAQTETKTEEEIASFELLTSLTDHTEKIQSLAFSPDENWLASSSVDETVRLWNFQTGIPKSANLILKSDSGLVSTLLFPDSETVAGSAGNGLVAWNLAADIPTPEAIPLPGHTEPVSALLFSFETNFVAMPSEKGNNVELWADASEPYLLKGPAGTVHSLAFSTDGRWLASGSADSQIIVWDTQDSETIASSAVALEGHTGDVYAVVFSPDGTWLASAGADSRVLLWDIRKGIPSEPSFVLGEHRGPVRSLAFSPGGRWLASAGEDSSVRLWDLSLTDPSAHSIVQLDAQIGPIHTVIFSPKGRWLLAAGNDPNILIWGTGPESLIQQACKIAKRNLTWQESQDYLEEYFPNAYLHKTCQDLPIHSSIPLNLRDLGDQLAMNGDVEGATEKYQEARDLDPEIDLAFGLSSPNDVDDPEARARSYAAQALIVNGDSLAQSGDLDGALAKYREAIAIDPSREDQLEDLEAQARSWAIQALLDIGDAMAQAGDIDGAIAKYQEAIAIDSSGEYGLSERDAIARAKDLASRNLVDDGDSLAGAGDLEGAVAKYEEALAMDPARAAEIGDPATRAKDIYASALLAAGDELARAGNTEEAVAKYREAIELGGVYAEQLGGDPEGRAKHLAALTNMYQLIDFGSYRDAARQLQEVLTAEPSLKTKVETYYLNLLCRSGSLNGFAADVKQACELLGERESYYGFYIDSRAINRALLGNFQGAIEDLELAIEWFSNNGNSDRASRREEWLTKLKAGQNPFDQETLDFLETESP